MPFCLHNKALVHEVFGFIIIFIEAENHYSVYLNSILSYNRLMSIATSIRIVIRYSSILGIEYWIVKTAARPSYSWF